MIPDLLKNKIDLNIPLNQARKLILQKSLSDFNEFGWPTKQNERWKYLPPPKELFAGIELADETHHIELNSKLVSLKKSEHFNLLFIDGIFNKSISDFSSIIHELEIRDLNEALTAGDIDGTFLSEIVDGVDAARSAVFGNGTYLKIKPNRVLKKPLHIMNVATGPFLVAPQFIIEVGENSKLELVESYFDLNEELINFEIPFTKIHVNRNARVEYLRTQDKGLNSIHLGKTKVVLSQGSSLESTVCSFGGKHGRHEMVVRLLEPLASAEVNGIVVGQKDQKLDHQSSIEFVSGETSANQHYKTMVDGNSRAVFNGRILIQQNAQKVASSQLNNNLLLSNLAEVDSKPQLEIFADDVKASHGATVGQLNREEIFYLQSRGLSAESARKMISKGFVDEIKFKVSSDLSRSFLDLVLSEKMRKM